MTVSTLGSINSSSIQAADLTPPSASSVTSLDDIFIEKFASSAVGAAHKQDEIYQMLASPDITNPELLSKLQIEAAQYNIDVTFLNALVRKAVGTAETLLRAS